MASLSKRGSRWTIRFRNRGEPNLRRHSLPATATKRDAERKRREIEISIDDYGYWEPEERSHLTLTGLVDDYKEFRKRQGASEVTMRGYAVLDDLVEHIKGRSRQEPRVDRLTRGELERFIHHRVSKGKKASSYTHRLKAFWNWAYDEHREHVEQPRRLRFDTPKPPVVMAPTWEHIDGVLATLGTLADASQTRERDTAVLSRALTIQRYTGLRIGQASGLRWEDHTINLDNHGPALNIGPAIAKTKQEATRNRWIPVHPELHKLLLQWRMEDGRPAAGSRIVAGEIKNLYRIMNAAWEAADVPEERWQGHQTHALRKRVISHMVERGISDAAIDHLVGHAPRGVRARHYVDSMAFFPAVKAAVATIPAIGASATAQAATGS